jgi:hypothetical protein
MADTASADALFEAAVEAVIAGDLATLRRLLAEDPELVRRRSSRPHRSALLHYVSANGVEDARQVTPPNVVEVAAALLDAGADVNAASEAYGGGSTTLGLTATSVHPERAGVQIALLRLLLDRGAVLEGAPGTMVRSCLANGRGAAAAFLAAHGAGLDLASAAGVGRLDLVAAAFDERGGLRPPATREQMDAGFLWACQFGHDGVAGFLLDRGVDIATGAGTGLTGLHWAVHAGRLETVKLLLTRGAPLEARNVYGGTALDQLRWSQASDPRPQHGPILELLMAAGARTG